MTNPLVSIIIPCYNHGKFIQENINSCLNQTYQNIEVIAVNDGSTDSQTNEIFNTYKNPKVKLITTSNQGLPSARNNAIANAVGEFIIPLDADDKLDAHFVEKTLKVMLENPKVGVVYTDQQFFGEEHDYMPMKDFDFAYELVLNHVSVCSLIRKEVYEQVKNKNGVGYNPNMQYGYEDWDFWINTAELGWKFKCVHEPLFWYRKSSTSMMSKTAQKIDPAINQLIDNHKESFEKYHHQIIAKLHYLYREREIYSHNLEKDIKNNGWLVKRIIKNVKP